MILCADVPDAYFRVFVARFENGSWTSPRSVADDGWVIPGCPVNGPAIAVRGNEVAVAWFTVVGDEKQIRVARSRDGGDSFSAPLVVEAGNVIGRVDVVLTDDLGAVVSYVSAPATLPIVNSTNGLRSRAAMSLKNWPILSIAWPAGWVSSSLH